MSGELRISFFFPVYNDEVTIREVALAAIDVCEALTRDYEIIIVDDCSPDRSGEIADDLSREHPDRVRVIHHSRNLGYGAAANSGIAAAKYEWICMVDGDHQYDVQDVARMLKLKAHYKLMIGFRYKRLYSRLRIFISYFYNLLLRFLFRTPYRDVSTGIRCLHREILEDIEIRSSSPFFGAELAIKAMLAGYPVGEFGIQTFPRRFGSGSAVTIKNIFNTIRDMFRVYREVFSDHYQLPKGRYRKGKSEARSS